jgi:hypothetical protein
LIEKNKYAMISMIVIGKLLLEEINSFIEETESDGFKEQTHDYQL